MPGTPFGKYRLLEPIAAGGMAEVYRAEMPGAEGFRKEVALKLVRGDHSSRPEFAQMFVQEARLAARLSHANVVQVFEFDRAEGRYYIAMEYVHGRTLRDVVDRCREEAVRFGLARSVHVCAEVAKALGYAHRLAEGGKPLGIVHRDVSPHNVLVSFEGEVKLADFGIARAMNVATQGVTTPGTIKGKVAYMAPEQARGEVVDARADVFALGVILWELCTGRRLFARDSDVATLQALLAPAPIPPPSQSNELVPKELDEIVVAALQRDAGRRTASANELATALSGVLLKLARSAEDIDLRALMQKLWPEAAVPPSARVREPTAVIPASSAPAPLPAASLLAARDGGTRAERPGPAPAPVASAPHDETRLPVPSPPRDDPAAATRTSFGVAPPAPRPARSRAPLYAGLVVLLAAAAGGAAWSLRPRQAAPELAPPRATTPPASALPAVATPEPKPVVIEPPPPKPQPAAPAVREKKRPRPEARPARSPVLATGAAGSLPIPGADSGEGILFVDVNPWAEIFIDGFPAGETPIELRVRAGRHRLRAVHTTSGRSVETEVVVKAGERSTSNPQLPRR